MLQKGFYRSRRGRKNGLVGLHGGLEGVLRGRGFMLGSFGGPSYISLK